MLKYNYLELHPKKGSKVSNKGLSESFIRKKLEKQGYIVWRSEYFHLDFAEHYPNVRKEYEKLRDLMEKHHPGMLEQLKYLNHVHHGMPDLIVFKDNAFKFIECKFNNEQLLSSQRKCISKLLELGFKVEIIKLIDPKQRIRSMEEDVLTKEKKIKEKQMKLKKRY